ncbi:MAG: serine hydrolase [Pseudomonadota bacterium]
MRSAPSVAWRRIRRRQLVLAFGAAALPALSDANASAAAAFPGKSWEQISLSDQSAACREGLAAAGSYLQTLATTALVAVREGRIIFSYGPTEEVSVLASARKSVLSMMYGKYVADGTIDLEQTLEEIGLDDIGGLLPIEREARVRDLLTARSGVYHASSYPFGDNHASAPARGSRRPSEYFLYSNWDFNAAGTVFERLTKKEIYAAFAEDLANPLQFQDFDARLHQRTGDLKRSEHLAYPFFLSTRDMARLGLLMLNEGSWNSRQLLPRDWVKTTTSLFTPSRDMHPPETARRGVGYGYLWWVLEEAASSPLHGAYTAWGDFGQFILVIPKHGMVIAHKRKIPEFGAGKARKVAITEFLRTARMIVAACS